MRFQKLLLSTLLLLSIFFTQSEKAHALYKTCAYRVVTESYPVTDGRLSLRERLAVKRIKAGLESRGFHKADSENDDKWLTLKITFLRLDTNTINFEARSSEGVSVLQLSKASTDTTLRNISRALIRKLPTCDNLFRPFETCPELSPADQRLPLCSTLGNLNSSDLETAFTAGARCQSYSRCIYRIAAINAPQSIAVWTSPQQAGTYILQASNGRFGRFNFREAENFCSSLNRSIPSIATQWSLPTQADVASVFQDHGAAQATLLETGHNYWLANAEAHNAGEEFSTPIFLMNRLDKTALMQVGTSQSRTVNTVCIGK